MLKCDFGNLSREVALLEQAGAEILHLDVMDGHFVPNLSYGPMVIASLRKLTDLPFDAHLMIDNPAESVDEYVAAGCQAITVHAEAVARPQDLLGRIRQAGCLAGLAINPATPPSVVKGVFEECDLLLVMSVEPGFGGQAFKSDVLAKVRELRQMANSHTLISIDGGVGPSTIGACAQAGVNLFVVGSAIFDEPDYGSAIAALRRCATEAI